MAEKNYAEMSRSERMTFQAKKRKEVVAELRKNPDALEPTPKVTGRPITHARRQDGVCESPDLTAARIAEEARRKALKNPAPVQPAPAPLEVSDQIAIFEAFCARTPDFHRTQWNTEMMSRCLEYNETVGNFTFSSSGLDSCFKFLSEGGYLETRVRHRGQGAPREFPEYVQPEPVEDINAKRPLTQPSVTQVISKEEHDRLKNMPLEELAAEVRRGYNTRRHGEAVR
jgi:hypothetical protein